MDPAAYRLLLQHLGRFDRAIDSWTEFIASQPDNRNAVAARVMIYSRTGQNEKAEQDLATLRKWSFASFHHLYWCREIDAAKAFLRQHPFDEPLYKYYCCFLLGDIEQGINHLEEDIRRGQHPAVFRSNLGHVLPRSILREVEQHPRFQTILKQFSIDDNWSMS